MPGILANEAAGAVQQGAEGQPVDEAAVAGARAEPAAGDESTPTPQEQEAFTRVEIAAKAMIHKDKKTFDGIVAMLQSDPENPAKALATAAMTIFGAVDEQAKGGIPETVILRGAEVTLDLIIKVAMDTGTIQVDEAMANRAVQELMVLAGEMYEFDPEEIAAEIQGMDPNVVQELVAGQQQIAGQGQQQAPGGQGNGVTR